MSIKTAVTFLLVYASNVGHTKVFNLGILFPWTGSSSAIGKRAAGAVTLALHEIRENNLTFAALNLRGHRLVFQWRDDQCEQSVGLPLVAEMAIGQHPGVDAFIGPGCSVICEPGGLLAAKWNVPMVSWGCTSSKLSSKEIYSTFARTTAPNADSAPFFLELFSQYNFSRTTIYHSSEHVWTLTAAALKDVFTNASIEVQELHAFEPKSKHNHVYESLITAKEESRGKVTYISIRNSHTCPVSFNH